MIKNTGDATVIVPMIKDYLEVSVKNDDALVKLAAVCQRLVSASGKDDEGNEYGLTDEERARLLEEAEAEIEKLKPETEVANGIDKNGNRSGTRDMVTDPVQGD